MNDIERTLEYETFKKLNLEIKKDLILKKFFHSSEGDFEEQQVLFWPFVDKQPFKYLNGDVYDIAIKFFEENDDLVIESILENNRLISQAIMSFYHISDTLLNEKGMKDLSPENIFKLDTVINQEYFRVIETIYSKIIDIIIYILDKIVDNKDYSNVTKLSQKNNILKANQLGEIANCCNIIIRNAIAHGSVYYEFDKISFYDEKKSISLYPYEFLKLLDNAYNTCSSILLSLFNIMICDEKKRIFNDTRVPNGIIFIYISSLLEHSGIKYLYVLENELGNKRNQIVFEVKTNFKARNFLMLEAFKLAYHLNTRFKHKYHRIGLHINSGESIKSSIFLNLENLNDTLQLGDWNSLSNSLENDMLWHDDSKIVRKLKMWRNILHYSKHTFSKEFKRKFYESGDFVDFKSFYIVKDIDDRSTKKNGRIKLSIVLIKPFDDELLGIIQYIVRKYRKAQKLKIVGFVDKTRKTRPNYIWGTLYRQNLRIRELDFKENKICDFEWITKKYRNKPVLLKDSKIYDGIRIKLYDNE